MRLDKFLSHTGHGSRKEVKQILKKKIVLVNGEVHVKGEFSVDPKKDLVLVNGEEITYQKYIYLMLHKPAGVLSATEDSRDKTVVDLLNLEWLHFHPFPVGRLDKDTEGLLLLTNDGELAHFLLSPRREVKKTYYARVDGLMDEEDIAAFEKGIVLDDDYVCLPAELEIQERHEYANQSEVLITIQEGKFHQVKRMVQACGKEVEYLKRLSMGSLQLDETLKRGEYRELTENELKELQQFLPQIEK